MSGLVPRCVVTGVGLVTPVGTSTDETWLALLAGRSGVRAIDRFDVTDIPTRFGGLVPDGYADRLPAKLVRHLDPFAVMGLSAAAEAVMEAGIDGDDIDSTRVGVVVGNCCGAASTQAGAHAATGRGGFKELRRTYPFLSSEDCASSAATECSRYFGFSGPTLTLSTECASGTTAIGTAAALVAAGQADVVLCGGAEAPISYINLAGASSIKALSTRNDDPAAASRPFDADRDGFVFAEGAGMLVLESEEHALRRGASIRGSIRGYGAASDAYHATKPDPSGAGALRAVTTAFATAEIAPGEVDVISAHGTGTPLNDPVELELFRRALPLGARPAVHSIKGAIGHTLGAAGAIEAVVLLRSLETGLVPPTVNCDTPICDDALIVRGAPLEITADIGLSVSFGFGGQSAAVVIEAPRQRERR